MCGIVGVLGNHEAAPILVEALKRLEYRGYDSAGIATVNAGTLDRRRAVGKLVNLSDLLVHDPLAGKAGIGHTRWATHGAPSAQNAHPHQARDVAVVHNGIIENYKELRSELAAHGMECTTETDTETIALLTQMYMDQGMPPRDAAARTLTRLTGAFALAFLFQGQEDLMIVTRKGSPLAIGHGKGEVFVGSDAIALAPLTQKITYLEEGDFAVLSRDNITIADKNGHTVKRDTQVIELDTTHVEKGGYKHFMAKEIAEQPKVIQRAITQYIIENKIKLPDQGMDFTNIERITIVACGTAFYAGLTAKYWFEQIANIPVEVDIASELRYREPPVTDKTAALFVSQSGETADTLAALRYMKGKAAQIIGVVNVKESSIARESDLVLPIYAGPEIGVASTKAFSCQLTVLCILALKAAQQRASISTKEYQTALAEIKDLPNIVQQALKIAPQAEKISQKLAQAQDVLFLGRGQLYPLALEGALKLKEISYIHAEGYAAGELKHGPIALIDKKTPVVVMAPSDELFDKTISNMNEVIARGGKITLISDPKGIQNAGKQIENTIQMPKCNKIITPIIYAIPAQIIAYKTAIQKGTDVDQPRNLAKSVTVE